MGLENVQNIILVLSGKGGVGKSSVTTQLALTLSLQGHSVGVLDIDLTGPSVPRFFNVEDAKVRQAPGGWIPVPVHEAHTLTTSASASSANGTSIEAEASTERAESAAAAAAEEEKSVNVGPLSCMSLGFILSNRTDAVIWRGPKKTAMVRQFLSSVLWPAGLSYLLIDTPPGTSDEHISLMESLLKDTAARPAQLAGAVVVTTPQAVSISDVKKELNFCRKTGVRVLGVLENMAGFVCPSCSECTNVFSKGGGEVMAREFGVRFLGSVPIDPAFVVLVEEGRRPVYPGGTVVAGRELGGGQDADAEAQTSVEAGAAEQEVKKDPGTLVDKYTSCSLSPIFDGIVKQVVADIEANKRQA